MVNLTETQLQARFVLMPTRCLAAIALREPGETWLLPGAARFVLEHVAPQPRAEALLPRTQTALLAPAAAESSTICSRK